MELSEAQQEKITLLFAVADELCLDRQGHRGYPELQQTQQAFQYPEAWKLVHELVTYANMEAADHIAAVFHSTILLQAQRPPPEENIKGVSDVSFYPILKHFPYFKSLELPEQRSRSVLIDIICTSSHYRELIGALKKVDVAAVRQLMLQPHHYPQLGVLEGMIKDALLREEYVVKRISAKPKKAKFSFAELLEKAGGKHHSLRAVVAPYTSPFDHIFDIYVQHMLTGAIQDTELASFKRRQEVDEGEELYPLGTLKQEEQLKVESLHKMTRLCNIAVANARNYESSMTSVDLAVYAQHSSICVEAFIKKMEDGIIQLCYPAPGLQGVVSIQTIKTKLVTKSDRASSAVYTAKVTCVDGPCRIMEDLNYTVPADPEKANVSMVVFYQKDGQLARCDIVPEYAPPIVVLSPASVQLAMDSTKDTAPEVVQILNDEQHQSEDTAKEGSCVSPSEQVPSHDLIQEAPFFIVNVPFLLKTGQVVKIWLRSDGNEYVLTPKPQLVELNRDVRICLEHNSDIQSCFTQCALAESSTLQYSTCNIYFRIWEELVRAEAAANSVGGKEQFIFHDFQLEFAAFRIPSDSTSSDYYCPVGEIWATLPREFLSNRQDIFPIEQGSFVCIRFDVELREEKEEDCALLAKHKDHLYPGATDNHVRTVMHMVVDRVTKMAVKEEEEEEEETEEVRMTLEDAVITTDIKVNFKVVGRQNARVSPLMKDVLMKKKPRCEMQLFPMFLPIKKVYQTLRHLERKLAGNSIGENVILGRVDQLVGRNGLSKYSGTGSDHGKLLKLLGDPNVLCHQGIGGRTPLNKEQITALVFSLMNKFQLIQGPPGTGKSITGAHLAYAFVLLNRKKAASEPASAEFADPATAGTVQSLPHLKCVLYCGPSNASVDVVLGHLHHLAKSSLRRLRILRMYGKTIETRHYKGPYYDPDLFVKRDKYDIDDDLRQYALHEMVHSREEIKKLDKKFAKMCRGDLIPTAEQRFQYREHIRQAEEDVIKKGQFDIVLCTCNETSGYRFRSNIAPIQCIIDEAGMTTEPEAVVALSQAEQVVLIGDHMQLQPVVKNRIAGDKGLRVSLFERYANLLKQEFPEGCTNFQQLLNQYRMVKSICDFPSEEFYNGKLVTVCEDAGMVADSFWPHQPDPIAFCNIVGKEEDAEKEEDMKNSKQNEEEARAVVNVVVALDVFVHSMTSIAVITPYKAQKKLIERRLKPKQMKATWRVQTVDESQGSEADYVVLSMVRSKPVKLIKDKTAVLADRKWRMENLGMVADEHHLCVALTRARFGLVIIGNKTLLSYSGTWNNLIRHYTKCRYIVEKQWADKALDRAKEAAKKQPPPPSKRERPVQMVKDEEMAELFSKGIEAHVKLIEEGFRKKPRMLQEPRKPAAAT